MVQRARHPALDSPARQRRSRDLEDLVRGQDGLSIRVITWNLSHGREFPPVVSGTDEGRDDCGEHAGYRLANRDLFTEFAAVLDSIEWDCAFLQECPPRWVADLAAQTGSNGRFVPTARNWMSPATRPIAARRPNLVGSWEGGSNAILVRVPDREDPVAGFKAVTLTRLPERRVMLFSTLSTGLCLANFHASTGPASAEPDVLRAARSAISLAGGRPLVFGGDFNCRPQSCDVFRQLDWEFGLIGSGSEDGIDHLLSSGELKPVGSTTLPDRVREPADPATGLRLRLSDHPVVVSDFSF